MFFSMEWVLGFIAIALLIVGLVGQAFEMKKIRIATHQDELASANIFLNKKNFKWYAIIGAGMILWYAAERS
jgi:glucose uptake protein GlcU